LEKLSACIFKPVEFDGFRKQAGLNSLTLRPKQWIEATSAIGIVSKARRYGGANEVTVQERRCGSPRHH
jgi:hypothetical protein